MADRCRSCATSVLPAGRIGHAGAGRLGRFTLISARMHWLLRRAVAGFALLAFSGLVIVGTLLIKHVQDMEWLLRAISSRCVESRDASGYGAVAITGDLTLEGVSGSVPTPCRLYLRIGVHLTIRNAHLHTESLFISNGPVLHPTGSGGSYTDAWPKQTSVGTTVTISGSSLTGGDGSQVQVGLREKSDRLSVDASTIAYPMLVEAAVGNDATVVPDRAQGGGVIHMRGSTIRAIDERGYGIQIGASQVGGVATFTNVHFETGSRMYVPAFLHAASCHADQVPGITPDCQRLSGPSKVVLAPAMTP